MADEFPDYVPRAKPQEGRYPPKYIAPAWAPGEDYHSMVAKHGIPHGPFDKERQLPYRG